MTENDTVEEDHAAFVVGQASSEEEDDQQDDDAFLVHGTGLANQCLREESVGMGLSDTCCAKTVAASSRAWQTWYAISFHIREGAPKVYSTQAVMIPLRIPNCDRLVMIRASVVEQDVPLLVSRSAAL